MLIEQMPEIFGEAGMCLLSLGEQAKGGGRCMARTVWQSCSCRVVARRGRSRSIAKVPRAGQRALDVPPVLGSSEATRGSGIALALLC